MDGKEIAVQLGRVQAQLAQIDQKVTTIEAQSAGNHDHVIRLCTRVEVLVEHYEGTEKERSADHNSLIKVQSRVNVLWFLGGGLLLALVLDVGTRVIQLLP